MELAFAEICARLRKRLTREVYERFADGMRLYLMSTTLVVLKHTDHQPPSMAEYTAIRRYIDGVRPCVALLSAGVDACDYNHPVSLRLRQHAANVVAWSNDVISVYIEARQSGQFWSMVLTYAAAGHRLQESVDLTARRTQDEVTAFDETARTIAHDEGIQDYAFALRRYVKGFYDWCVLDTKRYEPRYAALDADDTHDRPE